MKHMDHSGMKDGDCGGGTGEGGCQTYGFSRLLPSLASTSTPRRGGG